MKIKYKRDLEKYAARVDKRKQIIEENRYILFNYKLLQQLTDVYYYIIDALQLNDKSFTIHDIDKEDYWKDD